MILDNDEMTTGIVMQTSAQKALFDRWGENLVLDWTHNTNNLGFYLGRLLQSHREVGIYLSLLRCVYLTNLMINALHD